MNKRHDGRDAGEHRSINVQKNFTKYAPGSILIEYGNTKVLCTAIVEDNVPRFLKGKGVGWLTAEYAMLPGSTHTRISREVSKGKPSGRTSEIQRLIGRSLRAVIDLDKIGERTIYIDADVIQADGGTRTASITGGMVALSDAIDWMLDQNMIEENPIKEWVAAISVGKYKNEFVTDLCYVEDSSADLDMNVVMTESGQLVEIQGTAEKDTFSQEDLSILINMSDQAIKNIINTVKNI